MEVLFMKFIVAIEGKKFEFKTFAEAKFIYRLCRAEGHHEATLRRVDGDEVLVYNHLADAFFPA
jgi:hypothetical protein